MAESSQEPHLSAKAAAHAARRADINAAAKAAFLSYRESGDESAFNDLLDKLSPYTRATLRNVFGIWRTDEQEDVFQDVAVRFLSYAGGYDAQRPFLPWWHRIVRNVVSDFRRKSAKRLRDEFSTDDEALMNRESAVTPSASQTEDAIIFRDVFNRLSEEDRAILYYHYVEQFTAQELSEQLGKPVDTVKYFIRRARTHLRKLYEPDVVVPETPTITESQDEEEPRITNVGGQRRSFKTLIRIPNTEELN